MQCSGDDAGIGGAGEYRGITGQCMQGTGGVAGGSAGVTGQCMQGTGAGGVAGGSAAETSCCASTFAFLPPWSLTWHHFFKHIVRLRSVADLFETYLSSRQVGLNQANQENTISLVLDTLMIQEHTMLGHS